ncbi:hypothetical protein, partial [Porphyromonas sp.]
KGPGWYPVGALLLSEGGHPVSAGRSIFLQRKTNFRGEEKYLPCGGKFTAVRTAVNFYAHRNKFSCAQKNIFVRTKI